MESVKSKWGHQDSIKIEWNLGKRCNYDCGYCPSSIHDNESPHTELTILKRTVDKLMTLPKPVRLSLTGGEPCVHPNIEQLLSYIKSKNMWLSVTTNGTRKYLWYNMQQVDQYVFSLHFEYDWRSVLHTIKNVYEISNGIQVVVHIMAHQNYMKEVREAVDLLKSNQIPYVIRRVRWTEGDRDLFDDLRYDQNDLDWILGHTATVKPNCIMLTDSGTKELHANDIIKLHLNQFKDWTCNAGLESLMINWDGEVHRATCRVGGSLGNIYNETFVIPTESVVCDRNYCTCASDIPLTKFKLKSEIS